MTDLDSLTLVIADPNGVIRFWSGGAESAFGHASADAVGQTLDLIVPLEFREAHWTGFQRAIAAGSAAGEGEASPFPVRCADGAVTPALGRLHLARSPQGRVVAAMVVFD